ncbi:GNAT family N-acetyltransferase [Streptomyces sp. enrichment culture]|uniref:GNAT family N-acetyltransferase n=1 Tax=Streptomyces sp. enrichment culture TaxID=1795815 RepID=UPI003F54796F
MAAVNADPEVIRWIRDGSVRDEQQTRGGIQAGESEWESQDFGLFAMEIRSTGALAGFTGLSVPHYLPEVLPAVEVGWRLGDVPTGGRAWPPRPSGARSVGAASNFWCRAS